jgi:anion-transporting  ArsA/GET3 family ATPase
MSGSSQHASLGARLARHEVIVCAGTGGVGKTTIAAALGVAAAYRGDRVCVLTVDPARRLKDALGVGHLGNDPVKLQGPWPGELWALMLDPQETFDGLVKRYARGQEQIDEIMDNRMYRALAQSLSGTHEYMAAEKLYELSTSGRFDTVVVDTPPTRNALDFLDAPGRLARFLENRLFRLLLAPTRAYLRAVSVPLQALLRTISRVAGAEIVDDAIGFFRAFDGMEDGFRERFRHVADLLSSTRTGFVLVVAPRQDSIEEAEYFARRLMKESMEVAAIVVNRLHPTFDLDTRSVQEELHKADPDNPCSKALRAHLRNVSEIREASHRETSSYEPLVKLLPNAFLAKVPFLVPAPSDTEALETLAKILSTGTVPSGKEKDSHSTTEGPATPRRPRTTMEGPTWRPEGRSG